MQRVASRSFTGILIGFLVGGLTLAQAARGQGLPGIGGSLARDLTDIGSGLIGPRTHAEGFAPNDPVFAIQWAPQQVRVEPAWDMTRGAGATVAVVDSGVDLDHPDLAANVISGNTFLGCGDRGCGNGDWQSGHPHGTHVAGIVAAVMNNGTGIVGVAPAARILAIRALDADGSGTFEDIAHGIRFAVDRGADVINLSLGALPGSQALAITGVIGDVAEAIEYANARDVVVVAAAGNEAVPLCDTPGFDAGVVCVTATDSRELKAWYANAPVKLDLISLAAPGGAGVPGLCHEDIVSTVPPGTGTDGCGYPQNRAYDEYAGTSMAAPHVAGVAALLASLGCPRAQTISLLSSTARLPYTTLRGIWTPAYGYGIVDAEAAVQAARSTC